jgi:hypothetical protein
MNSEQFTAIKNKLVAAVLQTITTEMNELNELHKVTNEKGEMIYGTVIITFKTDSNAKPILKTAALSTTAGHDDTLKILNECINMGIALQKQFN